MYRTLTLTFIVAVLSGCDRSVNVTNICDSSPELCIELQQNNLCLRSRSELIRSRYITQQSPTVENQYQQLLDAEDYRGCMDTAAQMIDSDRETAEERNRGHWFQQAHQLLERFKAETKDDPSPLLSLYHWLRDKDRAALNRFLAAEQAGAIHGKPTLQLTANYFIEKNPEKAHHYLQRLLDNQPIDPVADKAILELAIKSYQNQGMRQQALVLAQIINDSDVTDVRLAEFYGVSRSQIEQINQEVAKVRTLLIEGKFNAYNWKL